MKKVVGVFFGGKSCEHDVSIITGMQVLYALKRSEEFQPLPIYITKDGEFVTGEMLFDVSRVKEFQEGAKKMKKLALVSGSDVLFDISKNRTKKLCNLFCAVLCLHGENGEDGSLQGLLQLCGIPQSSGGVLSQSVGMDKEISKILAKSCGVNVLEFKKYKNTQKLSEILAEIDSEGAYPYVIKPNTLGSSIGVKLCANIAELENAFSTAFLFACEVLCERGAVDFCELNISCCSLLGKVEVSHVERPKQWHEILTFEDKYIEKGKQKTGGTVKRECPAQISTDLQKEIEDTAIKLYECFKLSGIVRFDFILEDDVLYYNEVNTIPGSLSNYLWHGKIKFTQLLERNIFEARKRQEEKSKLEYLYTSSIF